MVRVDTRMYTYKLNDFVCACVHARADVVTIIVAIKYIVLKGVFYNGFLLFIKTEGPLQSAAVCSLMTRLYLNYASLFSLRYCLLIK